MELRSCTWNLPNFVPGELRNTSGRVVLTAPAIAMGPDVDWGTKEVVARVRRRQQPRRAWIASWERLLGSAGQT